VTQTDPRRRPGAFITIEGPEGGGKTTQAERLRRALEDSGRRVTVTREPGGTVAGERIRDLLLAAGSDAAPLAPRTDALLFNAARAQLVAEEIEPALRRGDVVIATRYADSTLAYQGYGAGLPIEALRAIESFATGGRRPDLTILLDLPVELGLGRKHHAEVNRFEADFDVEFHRRVRAGFLELAAGEPDRFAIVDATGDESSVWRAVRAAVARLDGLAAIGEPDAR
jgi:dTMP kinase